MSARNVVFEIPVRARAVRAVTSLGTLLFVVALGLVGCSKSGPESPPVAPPAARTNSPARPELTNVYRAGDTVDLLARVEPARDAVRGEFRRQGNDLIIPAVRAAQLNLAVDLPEQYTLELDVARTRGTGSLNLGITVGGHQTALVVDGWAACVNGLNLVDGRLGEDNVTTSRFRVFPDSKSRTIRVIVRRESVLVDVDGNVFIDYRGDPSRLSFEERFFQRPRPDQLMLGGWEGEYRVSKWTLTPLGDEPVKLAGRPGAPASQHNDTAPQRNDTTAPSGRPVDAGSPVDDAAGGTSPPAEPRPGDSPSAKPVVDSPDGDPLAEKPSGSGAEPRDNGSSRANDRETEEPDGEPEFWRVRPDPYSNWPASNEDSSVAKDLSIPLDQGWVVIADSPSPYFLVGEDSDQVIHWSVYDVRTGQSVGKPCVLAKGEHFQQKLCPSGRYMQSYVGSGDDRRVEVHSFVTGERVYTGDSPYNRPDDKQRDFLVLNHSLLQIRGNRKEVTFQRVDLRSSQVAASWTEARSSDELTGLAVSPGGRYVLTIWKGELVVHELATGDRQGLIHSPEGLQLEAAAAFSRDGTELALIGREAGRPTPSLWRIDWQTGETALLASVRAEMPSLQNTYLLGPPLEWFPDKELLLYYGRDVIDSRTGKFCYQIPSNAWWETPRRTLGRRSILGMMPDTDPNHRRYRAIPLGATPLQTSLEVVRRGGIAADVGLPPLTVVDTQGGKVLSSRDNAEPVSISSVDRPSFPASQVELPMRLAEFREPETELRRIELADPPEAIAVAHFTLNGDDSKRRQDVVVRFDLQRGKPAGSLPIRRDFRLAAVSPDGKLALLGTFNRVDGYSRLDVIDLAQKQHVAGWRPFDDEVYREDVSKSGQPEAKNPMTATFVHFADNQRVLTGNPSGKLVCWQLPECRVVFRCEDFGKPLAASDDRRYLVGADQASLYLLDVQNGAWAGRLEVKEPPQAILRAGMSPDNRELAAVLGYQGRRSLVIWNLADGSIREQFDILYHAVSPGWSVHQHPQHRRLGLQFRPRGYLSLDDLYLIDRAKQAVVWQYSTLRGKHAVNRPDERAWFTEFVRASGGSGQTFQYWLTAAVLPSEKLLEAIRSAAPREDGRPLGRSTFSLEGENVQP